MERRHAQQQPPLVPAERLHPALVGPGHGRRDVGDVDGGHDLGREEEAEGRGGGGVGGVAGGPPADLIGDGAHGAREVEALVLERVPEGEALIVEADLDLKGGREAGW